MNTFDKTVYLLKYKGMDKFVAIDHASGGYPYQVDIWEAHRFATLALAKNYDRGFNDFDVYEVKLTAVLQEV